MGKIWKPWTLELVGQLSGYRSQLLFYRFWTQEKAQRAADDLNERAMPPSSENVKFQAARVTK